MMMILLILFNIARFPMQKALGMHGIVKRFSSQKEHEKGITLVIHYHGMDGMDGMDGMEIVHGR